MSLQDQGKFCQQSIHRTSQTLDLAPSDQGASRPNPGHGAMDLKISIIGTSPPDLALMIQRQGHSVILLPNPDRQSKPPDAVAGHSVTHGRPSQRTSGSSRTCSSRSTHLDVCR
jgi:hypothetical protein